MNGPPPPSPSPATSVELAVVGAGPCGLAVGAAARKAGVTCTLFDRGPLCASLLAYPPYMTFFSTSDKLEIGGVPFPTPEKSPTRREALAYYRRVAEFFELDVRGYEGVEGVRRLDGGFELRTADRWGRERITLAGHLVVATGGFHEPNFLGVPGEELPHVEHHYREPHPYWNREVVVVGGGNSAVEAALELFRYGAYVTLVHFAGELDRGVKPWIRPDIENRLSKGEITPRLGYRVTGISPDGVTLRAESDGREEMRPAQHVLALTGWRADATLLRSMGAPIDEATGIPIHDPETMETPVSGLFVAGVLAAGHDANKIFIENGRMHGDRIMTQVKRR